MAVPKTKPIPATDHDILVDRPTGHLATIHPDGRLSLNPVAVMWDGEYARVTTLESHKKYRDQWGTGNPRTFSRLEGTTALPDARSAAHHASNPLQSSHSIRSPRQMTFSPS